MEMTMAEKMLLEEMSFHDFRDIYLQIASHIRSPKTNQRLIDLYYAAHSVFELYLNHEFGTKIFLYHYEYFKNELKSCIIDEIVVINMNRAKTLVSINFI